MSATRNTRRSQQGTVVGDRMTKTVTVRVERTFKHPKYGKYVRRHKKYMAHDEGEIAHPGDLVEIVSCRPLSKLKRWRVARVIEAAATLDSDGGAS